VQDLEQQSDDELEALRERECRNAWSNSTTPVPDREVNDAIPFPEELKRINAERRRRTEEDGQA